MTSTLHKARWEQMAVRTAITRIPVSSSPGSSSTPLTRTPEPMIEPQYRLLGLTNSEAHHRGLAQGLFEADHLRHDDRLDPGRSGVLRRGGTALAIPRRVRCRDCCVSLLGLRPSASVVVFLYLTGERELMDYVLPTRFWLDSNHFLVVILVVGVGLAALTWEIKATMSGHPPGIRRLRLTFSTGLALSLGMMFLAGILMLFRIPGLGMVTRFAYTLLDVALALVIASAIVAVLCQVFSVRRGESE